MHCLPIRINNLLHINMHQYASIPSRRRSVPISFLSNDSLPVQAASGAGNLVIYIPLVHDVGNFEHHLMVSIKSKKSWVIRNCHWQLKSLGFGFKISPRQHIRNWHCFPSSIVCVLLSSSLPVAINFLVFPSIGIPPSPLFFVLLSLTSTLMGRGKKLQP